MFEHRDNLIREMKSPLNISIMALDEIQNRLSGNRIIADPNTPFCHLLEFGSSIASQAINAIDEKFPLVYPTRARTMSDLFMHMSDYDYLKLYSKPSSTQLTMMFPKKYLIDNAKEYNSNYKKVTIPKDTVFLVGRYYFGIYYPIDILINTYSNAFTVLYDTHETNPLHALSNNVVEKYDTEFQSLDFLVISFPIYQFSKSTKEESCVVQTGFHQKIMYNNDFYATRIYSYKNKKYHELKLTQTHVVYDATEPTAFIQVLPDDRILKIKIPQIYFDKGMMGSKILTEVYTTMGELDIDTAVFSSSNISANFNLQSKDTTEFSYILKNFPYDVAMTISNARLTGGSNTISVEKLRTRIINDNMYDRVPITEKDMRVHLEDHNFSLKKRLDNVTDREYHAYRALTDGNGNIVPSLTIDMRMMAKYGNDGEYNNFIRQSDNSITVMPTAIYKYQEEIDAAIPLTNEELSEIQVMNKKELCTLLNNGSYFRSPFHLRFDLNDSWPECISYNLMMPEVKKIIFEGENFSISSRMMSFAAQVEHMSNGTGGYLVAMNVYRSDDLEDIAIEDLLVYVTVKTKDNYWVGTQATYQYTTEDNRYVYSFNINTRYHITEQGELTITNFQNENFSLYENTVDLEQDWHVVFMIRKDMFDSIPDEAEQKITLGVPQTIIDEYIAMDRQYLTLHLGHSLHDVIKNDIDITLSSQRYEVYNHDIPAIYKEDMYERDSEGKLVFTKNDKGEYTFNKQYGIGEEVLDERGLKVYEHKKGEVIYEGGKPKVYNDRNRLYYTDVMFIDAKIFSSEKPSDIEFANSLPRALEGYFTIVKNIQAQLLERTKIYFRCVKSTGTALFNMGDGITSRQNLEMTFRLNCYVPSYVKQDEKLQQDIYDKICDAIEAAIKTKTISMLDIFEKVKNQMDGSIDHFSLLGINGVESNQTFIIIDQDAQPSIRHELVVDEDNILQLRKSIDVDFIALNDNTENTVTVEI